MHTISFQTFFVWSFKIVVDSWKFSMLLLYILWDDWPIFMISRSNEQLLQELEYKGDECSTIMSINVRVCVCVCIYIYIYVYKWMYMRGSLCVFMDGWPKRGSYLRHLWSGAGVSRKPFLVYIGAKTTEKAVPAKTCKPRAEEHLEWGVRRRGSQLGVELQSGGLVSWEWDSKQELESLDDGQMSQHFW